MRKAFFDPVGIEACFVQVGTGGTPQIVHSEWFKRFTTRANLLHGAIDDPVQRRRADW